MELVAVIDGGRPFVTNTYTLEGDGPLVLSVYDKLQEIVESTGDMHFPNTKAVAKSISPNNQARQQEHITTRQSNVCSPPSPTSDYNFPTRMVIFGILSRCTKDCGLETPPLCVTPTQQ